MEKTSENVLYVIAAVGGASLNAAGVILGKKNDVTSDRPVEPTASVRVKIHPRALRLVSDRLDVDAEIFHPACPIAAVGSVPA